MPENNKTQEFLQKLASCIERSDLDACVEEAARGGGWNFKLCPSKLT
ncbi:MAG: hypothetical protein OIN86_12190 [Candidatus Methanoperedens sp.]|nr:hypothetical protein [Candidatus Methanoperedens sp.]